MVESPLPDQAEQQTKVWNKSSNRINYRLFVICHKAERAEASPVFRRQPGRPDTGRGRAWPLGGSAAATSSSKPQKDKRASRADTGSSRWGERRGPANRSGSSAQEPTNVVDQNLQQANVSGMDTAATTVVFALIVSASQVR